MAASSNDSQTNQPGQPGNSGTRPTSPEETKDGYKPTGNRYFGALVLLAAIIPLPFLAALITIIVYLSPSSFQWLGASTMVIILGLIITLVLWLLLAIPCMRFATAKVARPSDCEGLKGEVKALENRLKVVKEKDETTQDNAIEHKKARDIVISDVEAAVDYINTRLCSQGWHWLSTGYVSLWDRVNEADEAIIDVLPCETVIESAKYEELRLKNSQVSESKALYTPLKEAIDTLSPANATDTVSSDPNRSGPSTAINGQVSQQREHEARANIRIVKAALHKFTNERWDGLVRARN